MANPQKPMRPLSIRGTLRSGSNRLDMPVVPQRVPAAPVAPDRSGTPTSTDAPATHDDLYVALIVPIDKYDSFSKWVTNHIRVVTPPSHTGGVTIIVLPDDGESVDFGQYQTPNLTLRKGVPNEHP